MKDFKTNLPFTFLLALLAAVPNAQATVSESMPTPTEPGSRRDLLDHRLLVPDDHPGQPQALAAPRQRIAQPTCISGSWRRC